MIDSWLKAINDDDIVGVVMVDFKKAFNLVGHNLFINKPKHYRFPDATIKLFSSIKCILDRKETKSVYK